MKTIFLTGGGSGGHITPVLAVAEDLKIRDPELRLVYVGQRGDRLADVASDHSSVDIACAVSAGKLRRYHGEGLKQLLDVKTMFFNIRDVFRTIGGFFQSLLLIRRYKPDVIFIKGGFVGVPVGLAAALLRVPYVTHDSDALPGLANRLVAPWAAAHAVALPVEVYKYPKKKTTTVGVPISREYKRVDAASKLANREVAGLSKYNKVLVVAGGGLGARRVNDAVAACAPDLLHIYPDLAIVHQAGRANEEALKSKYNQLLTPDESDRMFVKGFVSNMSQYTASADLVIARAGGTNLAELETQGKACIVVPNPYLTGGHQLLNANVLSEKHAIVIVREDELKTPKILLNVITKLLDNPTELKMLGDNLAQFAQNDAAGKLADILLDIAAKR